MGYGRTVDRVVGVGSRLLHIRSAKHNTVRDLEPYLDQSVDELFPAPEGRPQMAVRRNLVDRAFHTSTVTWPSLHEVLDPAYRVRHQGAYKRNLTAWGRWLRPEGRIRKTCIIYVHGWLEPGSWVEEATLFKHWSKVLDVDIVHVSLPFHGRRAPRNSLFSGEFFWTADLVRTVEGVRQAVCDTRTMMAWLREQGYERIGISGISLGGALTMITACVDDHPDFILPIIAHLKMSEAVERASILWRMKSDLEKWGIDATQRRAIFERLGIGRFRPVLAPERQLWIEAREDAYLEAHHVQEQWAEWGEPNLYWIEGGHMTFPLQVPKMTSRIGAFLDGLR